MKKRVLIILFVIAVAASLATIFISSIWDRGDKESKEFVAENKKAQFSEEAIHKREKKNILAWEIRNIIAGKWERAQSQEEAIENIFQGPCEELFDENGDGKSDIINEYTYEKENGIVYREHRDLNKPERDQRIKEYYSEKGDKEIIEISKNEEIIRRIAREYSYNSNGSLISLKIDANSDGNNESEEYFTYNEEGQLIKELVKMTPSPKIEIETEMIFYYREDGNMIKKRMRERNGAKIVETVTEYSYDRQNRVQSENVTGDEEIYIQYTYNGAGNRIMEERRDSAGRMIIKFTYEYDEMNRLIGTETDKEGRKSRIVRKYICD